MGILGKEKYVYCFENVIIILIKYTWIFGSIPNVIFVAYVIVKRPHDELFVCCMTFAYLFNNCSTFVRKFNNCTMSLANVFVDGIFKSYIVQCDLGVEGYILTKIQ